MSLLYSFLKKTHYESKINSHVEKFILSNSTSGKNTQQAKQTRSALFQYIKNEIAFVLLSNTASL